MRVRMRVRVRVCGVMHRDQTGFDGRAAGGGLRLCLAGCVCECVAAPVCPSASSMHPFAHKRMSTCEIHTCPALVGTGECRRLAACLAQCLFAVLSGRIVTAAARPLSRPCTLIPHVPSLLATALHCTAPHLLSLIVWSCCPSSWAIGWQSAWFACPSSSCMGHHGLHSRQQHTHCNALRWDGMDDARRIMYTTGRHACRRFAQRGAGQRIRRPPGLLRPALLCVDLHSIPLVCRRPHCRTHELIAWSGG